MRRDARWPTRCTLSGCYRPDQRPHHHHLSRGYLDTHACTCANLDEPGTCPRPALETETA